MPGRVAVKPFCGAVLAASLARLFSVQAVAQDAAIQFRVVATDRNPAACQRFDAALSRVHSFTVTASGASLRSAGGVNAEGLYDELQPRRHDAERRRRRVEVTQVIDCH
jgi:hypothetical protein